MFELEWYKLKTEISDPIPICLGESQVRAISQLTYTSLKLKIGLATRAGEADVVLHPRSRGGNLSHHRHGREGRGREFSNNHARAHTHTHIYINWWS